MTAISGSEQETVRACPFIVFGLERFCPGALGCQRWSSGPQCFRAEGPCLRAAFRILQTTGNGWVFPIRQPWDACGLGWYAPSEPGNAVRNPGSSKGSGNEPCRCTKPTAINGMRGFFPTSAACVKFPPPQDRSPSLDLRFQLKRLAGQPAPRRRAQTLKSPPNRAFYRFSLRALFSILNLTDVTASDGETTLIICEPCRFAKEPAGFTKLPGENETHRFKTFQNMLPQVSYTEGPIDVIINDDTIQRIAIGFQYRCRTCIVEKTPPMGIVNLTRPFVRPFVVAPKHKSDR